MNIRDSPVEALAFNYVRFGLFTFVNNLWTWVAVITAAVSFWRLRAATTTSPDFPKSPSPPSPPAHDDVKNTLASNKDKDSQATNLADVLTPAAASSFSAMNEDAQNEEANAKGTKFTLYYNNEVEDEMREEGGEGIGGGEGEEWAEGLVEVKAEECGGGEWWWTGEGEMRMRQWEMRWHDFQDLRKIDGNIVRLWDNERCMGGCRRRQHRLKGGWEWVGFGNLD